MTTPDPQPTTWICVDCGETTVRRHIHGWYTLDRESLLPIDPAVDWPLHFCSTACLADWAERRIDLINNLRTDSEDRQVPVLD